MQSVPMTPLRRFADLCHCVISTLYYVINYFITIINENYIACTCMKSAVRNVILLRR